MKNYLNSYKALYKNCRRSGTDFYSVVLRAIWYRLLYKKRLWLHQGVSIKGIRNIQTAGRLSVGIDYFGFLHKRDNTVLNINGKLIFKGSHAVGRGCRFDIGKNAVVTIGQGGYLSPNSKFIIMHELVIGDNCAVSWDCLFLDEDFHEIGYAGKKSGSNAIRIGNNVWIGCGVKIYKGSVIPDNCVIASDTVVKGIFTETNSLIGGNPAKMIKQNITWK